MRTAGLTVALMENHVARVLDPLSLSVERYELRNLRIQPIRSICSVVRSSRAYASDAFPGALQDKLPPASTVTRIPVRVLPGP